MPYIGLPPPPPPPPTHTHTHTHECKRLLRRDIDNLSNSAGPLNKMAALSIYGKQEGQDGLVSLTLLPNKFGLIAHLITKQHLAFRLKRISLILIFKMVAILDFQSEQF